MDSPIKFTFVAKDKKARLATLETKHGIVETPAFVVVGTKATVKSLTPEMIVESKTQLVLANTYHLYLQPGLEIIKESGGFPKFMHYCGPTMTDSGGFQVFSLGTAFGKGISKILQAIEDTKQLSVGVSDEPAPKLAKVGEDGVTFKSHIDGSLHYITPERSIEIQHALKADIIFAFDECTSPTDTHEYHKESLRRTHRWAQRSLVYHKSQENSKEQALFGIVQGGRFKDLREESAHTIGSMDFDGFGIGGSFDKEDLLSAVLWVNEILPEDKPRHLLGIGEPKDILFGVEAGCDLFDCVAPTRMARNGTLHTKDGRMNLLNAKFELDTNPIENDCGCYTCKNFTRSYLAHLFRGKEMLGGTLATIHNVYFMNTFFEEIRKAIKEGNFSEYKEKFIKKYYK